jgi:acetyl esterase/lipase
MAITFHKTLYIIFRPLLISIFDRKLPWTYRWRLLLLQPINLLALSISALPWTFSRAYTVEWLPVSPNLSFRALVFQSKRGKSPAKKELRPLHLDIHGGAFIGGFPEQDATFCDLLARNTGAVVISTTYRYAPEYTFPTAIDDIDAVVKYLQDNAEARWGADPKLMTVSGGSAGANLALAAAQQENCHEPAETAFKGAVTFHAVVSLLLCRRKGKL